MLEYLVFVILKDLVQFMPEDFMDEYFDPLIVAASVRVHYS
jgi:hypothetical protein